MAAAGFGDCNDVDDPATVSSEQKRRLDADRLLAHYQDNGQEQTYLSQECDLILGNWDRAVKVYVLPKYTMRYAWERTHHMQCAMALSVATTAAEVKQAAVSPRTGTYDLTRHMYLRHTFVTVYVLEDGTAVDLHKHFVEAAGQSEHSIFIGGLQPNTNFKLLKQALGPKNSQPGQKKHRVGKPKRSAALQKMLAPPLHEASQLPALLPVGAPVINIDEDENANPPPKKFNKAFKSVVRQEGEIIELDEDGDANPPQPMEEAAVEVDPTKCLARKWGKDGEGGQCNAKPQPDSEFCARHAQENQRKHGRVDGPVPDFMIQHQKKKLKTSRGALQQKQLPRVQEGTSAGRCVVSVAKAKFVQVPLRNT